MEEQLNTGTTSTSVGWTCAVCGLFVGLGVNHYCCGVASTQVYPPPAISRDGEIIDLLKRIVELLEESQGIIRLGEQE